MRNNYLLIPCLIVFLFGCGNSDNANYSEKDPDNSVSTTELESSAGAMPANILNLPTVKGKSKKALQESGILFLKKRGESNMSAAAIMGQAAAETEDFRYMYELGSNSYLMYLEGRKDLGNINKGDGPRFKGRGYIHLTGRANYRVYGKKIQTNLIQNPELAERGDYAMLIMHHYLLSKRYGGTGYAHARKGNIKKLTLHINGGTNGFNKRVSYYRKYLTELNAGKYNYLFGASMPRHPSHKAKRRSLL